MEGGIGVVFALWVLLLNVFGASGSIPTTLDGPFKPVTVPLDKSFRGNAIDLPDTDPRVQRNVVGFHPEQISVSLSSNHDSVWISWITGKNSFLPLFHISFLDSFKFILNAVENLEFSDKCFFMVIIKRIEL